MVKAAISGNHALLNTSDFMTIKQLKPEEFPLLHTIMDVPENLKINKMPEFDLYSNINVDPSQTTASFTGDPFHKEGS